MAITIVSQPEDFGRIYDTNRLMFKFSSTNYTQPNFRFYIDLFYADITENPLTWARAAIVRKRALADGTCLFNPAEVWNNYLSYDLEIGITGLTEALNSNGMFTIQVQEEYGDPPTLKPATLKSTDLLMLYNGLQEYIPYDITAYGGGNLQWVMSGVTITQATWVDCGTWNAETTGTFGTGEIKFTSGTTLGLSGMTTLQIHYTDQGGINRTGAINNIATDEYVKFTSTTNANKAVVFTYASQVQTATSTTWNGLTYYSKGSAMPMTGFTAGEKVKVEYTEMDVTVGQGKFLTDAYDFQVDTTDYANLYFIASKADKPTHARVTVYYWSDGVETHDDDGDIENIRTYTNNARNLMNVENSAISAPNTPIVGTPSEGSIVPIRPQFKYFVAAYTTGFTLSYTNLNNQMFYIPTGPKELQAKGIFDLANGDGGWISYKINLTNGITSPTKIYNQYPITYYRKNKCDRYDPIQLFWLNPHGGFDNYTFYKKNYTSYDVEKTFWQHRFSDTYVLGERGTTVFKTQAVQTITLNTDYLTASESQILSQLQMSPEVYSVYNYANNVYKIPYIINNTKFEYKSLKNEKVATMEISITPAWNRVSQIS